MTRKLYSVQDGKMSLVEFEVVSGKSIARQCNHVFAETIFENNSFKIKKDYSIFEKIQNGDSVFVKTDCLPEIFFIMKSINVTIKIVTHESDYVINDHVVNQMPKNIDRMFSVNVITESDKVIPIPLGIANNYCKITLKPENLNSFDLKSANTKALVSCNISNNPSERFPLYSNYIDNQVTVREVTDLSEYEKILSEHTFVFCPQGNGPDTHRFWESLYYGKIPIVKYSAWNRNFRDLPVLFVNQWDDAKVDTRENFLSNMRNICLEKLDANYWGDIINVK